jgi:magnesium transporter
MSPDFIAVREDMTVEQVLEVLRERADAESIFYVYVVDEQGVLKGVLNLRKLLTSPPNTLVRDIMTHGVIFVFPEQDQEEVAHIFARYDLLALPVVDHDYRLIGVITVDDVMDVLQEELTEDYFRMVGSDAAELERKTPAEIAKLRLPWLLITVVIELVAGFVIHRFDKTLGSVILLASFHARYPSDFREHRTSISHHSRARTGYRSHHFARVVEACLATTPNDADFGRHFGDTDFLRRRLLARFAKDARTRDMV